MERQLHMELYPGWSARDNYGYGSKKKKRKKDRGSPSDISSGKWEHTHECESWIVIVTFSQHLCRQQHEKVQGTIWTRPAESVVQTLQVSLLFLGSPPNNVMVIRAKACQPDYYVKLLP